MATILDDKLLSLRLQNRPEFHLRLAEFLHAYGVADRPALVLQARRHPDTQGSPADMDDPEVQARFLAGARTDNDWWQGFRAMTEAQATFHGIASLPSLEQPGWAAEMHRDGHFIAGSWRFPEFSVRGSKVSGVADFYVTMFNDFFQLLVSTLQVGSESPKYDVTATLVCAPKLYYAKRSHFGGQYVVFEDPLTTDNLQWPVAAARVGTPEWMSLAAQMSKALTGAYGDTPP